MRRSTPGDSRMKKTPRTFLRLTLTIMALCFTLAACSTSASGASTGGTSSNTGRTPKATATATPKAKATGLPALSVDACKGLMSLDEANQIMHPAKPATTIRVDHGENGGGSCNYEYAAFKGVVSVVFVGPVPQGVTISDIASQAQVGSNLPPGAKITTTPVSDVGDQALFI